MPFSDPPTCEPDQIHEITRKCENILGPIFESCSQDIDLEAHYDSCNFDVCVTEEEAAACKSLEALAVQCGAYGNPVNWRNDANCCELPIFYYL